MIRVAGPGDPGPTSVFADRRQIWFDDADGAYLAMAAMCRYLDATMVSDVVLVPTDHGPALELPSDAVSLRLVQALIRRFGGHIGRTGPEPVPGIGPATSLEDAIWAPQRMWRRRPDSNR